MPWLLSPLKDSKFAAECSIQDGTVLQVRTHTHNDQSSRKMIQDRDMQD